MKDFIIFLYFFSSLSLLKKTSVKRQLEMEKQVSLIYSLMNIIKLLTLLVQQKEATISIQIVIH